MTKDERAIYYREWRKRNKDYHRNYRQDNQLAVLMYDQMQALKRKEDPVWRARWNAYMRKYNAAHKAALTTEKV